ncbi:hypothetical protein [Flavobacterium sp. JP2137]|uniref:hypothetical protein n=1 Tax=Flavobacterium sp. JP2137 TaxID=3414510 RepID=UPI003D2FA88F
MSIFTYHLVKTSYISALKAVLFPMKSENIPGLIHAECMRSMVLGAAVFSPSRILPNQLAVFAQWEDEVALDNFLADNSFGQILATGWHTRLRFLRQWGKISGFQIVDEVLEVDPLNTTVVAVTLARLRLFAVPRFIHWGRPVEKLVRDHPETLLATASIRLPNIVSTFSIWKSQKAMTDMVQGHSAVAQPKRHQVAMKERNRKDFNWEFTTLRFKPLAEFGAWNGQTNIMDNLTKND